MALAGGGDLVVLRPSLTPREREEAWELVTDRALHWNAAQRQIQSSFSLSLCQAGKVTPSSPSCFPPSNYFVPLALSCSHTQCTLSLPVNPICSILPSLLHSLSTPITPCSRVYSTLRRQIISINKRLLPIVRATKFLKWWLCRFHLLQGPR